MGYQNRAAISSIMILGGSLTLGFGIHSYMEEDDFLRRAVGTMAKVEYVKDEPMAIITEGRFSGPQRYFDHVCYYKMRFSENESQTIIVTELTSIAGTCAALGSDIYVHYDPRSPSNTVRDQAKEAIIHPGLMQMLTGIFLASLGLFRLKAIQRDT